MEEQITKFKTLLKLVFEPKLLKALLSLRHSQYLVDIGWINSFKKQSPVDKDGNPIPWLTYPFIDFLTPRLKKDMMIFEFGSGNSTLFYSQRVKKVVTVEHNIDWYEKLKTKLPYNVILMFKELNSNFDYAKSAINTSEQYDIILVDGEERNECIKYSLSALKNDGVIVLDDSDRNDYKEGTDYLMSNSFRRLDFWGISPGYLNRKATTVFYRSKNSLGI